METWLSAAEALTPAHCERAAAAGTSLSGSTHLDFNLLAACRALRVQSTMNDEAGRSAELTSTSAERTTVLILPAVSMFSFLSSPSNTSCKEFLSLHPRFLSSYPRPSCFRRE